ncbi:hypothetical protein OHB41_33875 [Streptomyces sp. NBC_01571]|uniref:hypothetical protein n=1 Tax=Streptomyces sp. NBC_01571 TaxID=2975883 RepID=UPI00225B18B7|nr:hypothetical protein [Streptomyces sp. NBC_01571]MCX4578091.1 hypothetical protein [Streptomyces sp. NBC_01571]
MRPSTIRLRARTEAPSEEAPAQWHRVLTLLADISLFIGTRPMWTAAASHRLPVAAVISVCYASILATGVLALVARRSRTLARLDLVVLVTAVTLAVCGYAMYHGGSDESFLTTQAAREFVAGHRVYGQPWPWLFTQHGIALTPTMTGGYDFTYGYPPLPLLLTAPLLWVGHGAAPAVLVSTAALIVATIVMWRMLPVQWRPAATLVCLGLGLLPAYARLGYPAIVACAFLIPVVVGWPRMGYGGRGDWARAVCLGAACASQQLPWFLTPFLLAGVYALRRADLGPRGAAVAVGRIVGVAATTWLLINAYFIVSEPRTWFEGITLPLTQKANIHGQGLVGVSLYFTDGSGRLAWYSHASLLLAAGLLGLFVLFVRRLGPAATVLPWCAFYVATRSQDGYYLMMTPLWLAAAVTAPPQAFAAAWQPRPALLRGPRRQGARIAAAVLLLAPALAATTLAVTGSPPLRMELVGARRATKAVTALTVRVTNLGDAALSPHFTLTTGQGMSRYWSIASGPATLGRHASARYEIRPPDGKFTLPGTGVRIRLRAVSASPMTLSSTDIRLTPASGR